MTTDPGAARPVLKKGDKGKDVWDLQTGLVLLNYKLKVDGDFEDSTEKAVRTLQANNELRIDGICGPETWAAIFSALRAKG